MNNARNAVAEISTPQFWMNFPLPYYPEKTFTEGQAFAMSCYVKNFVASGTWACYLPSKIQREATPAHEYMDDLKELGTARFGDWNKSEGLMTFDGPVSVTNFVKLALMRDKQQGYAHPTILKERQIIIC